MKKYIVGLLSGIIICISFSVFASNLLQVNTVNYQVIVNGSEVTSEKFNYNGKTYLELRQTAELLNAEINWDKVNKIANIESKNYLVTPTPTLTPTSTQILNNVTYAIPTPKAPMETLKPANKNEFIYTDSMTSYRAIKQDDVVYVKARDIQDKYPSILFFTCKPNINKLFAINAKTNDLVFDSIPYILLDNNVYTPYSYYINTILPKIIELSQLN